MKTYLVTFFTDKRANGYAVINAPNPKIAESILKTLGRERENHYHIVHIEELFAPCQTLAIVNEGITTGGMSAYEIAVHLGFRGTAEEWLASLKGKDGEPGPQGIQGEQGLSAYEIAVLHGFEGTEAEWLDMLYRGDVPLLYTPSGSIPEDALSTPVGNLTSRTRSQLERMTLSQVFDGILFKELPASIDYNRDDNKVTSKGNLEVGDIYNNDSFVIEAATVTYKYVNGLEQSKQWVPKYSNSNKTVTFGNNNTFSVQFVLLWDEVPILTTSYGNPQTDVIVASSSSKTVEGKLTGYYKYGWATVNSISTNWHSTQMSALLNKTVIDTKQQTSYVYIALPKQFKLTHVEVRNPFDTTVWKDLSDYITKMTEIPVQISSLSTINKEYNIWRICKSAPNQGDYNDVTANDSPIRITTAAVN